MKRTVIATLLTLAAVPALAVTPSFNDQPELTSAKPAGVMGKAAVEAGKGAASQIWVPNY
jgi:hypothetical protein